jgi:hypothetical protein
VEQRQGEGERAAETADARATFRAARINDLFSAFQEAWQGGVTGVEYVEGYLAEEWGRLGLTPPETVHAAVDVVDYIRGLPKSDYLSQLQELVASLPYAGGPD